MILALLYLYNNTERNTKTLDKILEENRYNFSQKYCGGKWYLIFGGKWTDLLYNLR